MRRRGKRPAAPPNTYRDWLQRSEQGETPPQIAKADGYDVRTVRRNIEVARQEREQREARSVVYSRALEDHYADLVAFAARLDSRLKQGPQIPVQERQEPMWVALKEHLPRSPLWSRLDRWEHLQEERQRIAKAAISRMEQEVSSGSPLTFVTTQHPTGFVHSELVGLVLEQLQALAERRDVPSFEVLETPRPRGDTGLVVNDRLCGYLAPKNVAGAKRFILQLQKCITDWPEAEQLSKTLAELHRLEEAIGEELVTITLRRIVPGSCRYCPFR